MLDVVPTVVRVESVGTDWASLAAVISTGLVGVLGIGAAIWQAIHGWKREDRRARIAEKRKIYSRSLGLLTEFYFRYTGSRQTADAAERDQAARLLADALTACCEVQLISPDDVTDKLNVLIGGLWGSRDAPERIDKAFGDLGMAMRLDLGERPFNALPSLSATLSKTADPGDSEAQQGVT